MIRKNGLIAVVGGLLIAQGLLLVRPAMSAMTKYKYIYFIFTAAHERLDKIEKTVVASTDKDIPVPELIRQAKKLRTDLFDQERQYYQFLFCFIILAWVACVLNLYAGDRVLRAKPSGIILAYVAAPLGTLVILFNNVWWYQEVEHYFRMLGMFHALHAQLSAGYQPWSISTVKLFSHPVIIGILAVELGMSLAAGYGVLFLLPKKEVQREFSAEKAVNNQ